MMVKTADIPKRFIAEDKLGRTFEYRLLNVDNNGIHLYNETWGEHTDVEFAWFGEREITAIT